MNQFDLLTRAYVPLEDILAPFVAKSCRHSQTELVSGMALCKKCGKALADYSDRDREPVKYNISEDGNDIF